MTDQLKTCPFCGGKADYNDKQLGSYPADFVQCNKCQVSTPCRFQNKKSVSEIWNTRYESEKYEKLLKFAKYVRDLPRGHDYQDGLPYFANELLKEIGEE